MGNSYTNSYQYPGQFILDAPWIEQDEVIVFSGAGSILLGTIMARVTASGKIVPLVIGASDGTQNPVGVMSYQVDAAGAGDVSARLLVDGQVNRKRLILAADGNGNNITAALIDKLRAAGVTAIDVQVVGQTAP